MISAAEAKRMAEERGWAPVLAVVHGEITRAASEGRLEVAMRVIMDDDLMSYALQKLYELGYSAVANPCADGMGILVQGGGAGAKVTVRMRGPGETIWDLRVGWADGAPSVGAMDGF